MKPRLVTKGMWIAVLIFFVLNVMWYLASWQFGWPREITDALVYDVPLLGELVQRPDAQLTIPVPSWTAGAFNVLVFWVFLVFMRQFFLRMKWSGLEPLDGAPVLTKKFERSLMRLLLAGVGAACAIFGPAGSIFAVLPLLVLILVETMSALEEFESTSKKESPALVILWKRASATTGHATALFTGFATVLSFGVGFGMALIQGLVYGLLIGIFVGMLVGMISGVLMSGITVIAFLQRLFTPKQAM